MTYRMEAKRDGREGFYLRGLVIEGFSSTFEGWFNDGGDLFLARRMDSRGVWYKVIRNSRQWRAVQKAGEGS